MSFPSVAAALNSPKNNFAATVPPAAGNDNTQGYSVGSVWVNTVSAQVYRCLDASTGAAVWPVLIDSGVALSGEVTGTLPGPLSVVDGADSTAIHNNINNEIAIIAAKASPVSTDVVLIEDSGAGYAKKRVRLDALPTNSHAATHQHGGSDEIATGTPGANAIPKALGTGVLADGWISVTSVTQHEASIDHDALTNFVVGEHRVINDAGVSTTELWSSDKIDSAISAVVGGVDIKPAVDTTTTGVGDIALTGEQTLNGLLTSTSRVLVTEQTLPQENGIWVSAAGAWARAADADTDAEVTNGNITHVINSGSTKYTYKYLLVTPDPITVGVTGQLWEEHRDIDFGTTAGTATEGDDSRVPTQDENDALAGTGTPSAGNPYVSDDDTRLDQATDTALGIIEIATQGEVDTGTDTVRAVTPATLSGISGGVGHGTGVVTAHSDVSSAGSGAIVTVAERNEFHTDHSNRVALDAVSGTNTGDEVAATESVSGIAEIATQAEVNAGTDDLRFVTPLKLATSPYKKRTVAPSAINITLVAADIGKVILLTAGANATLPDPTVVGSGWWVDIKEAGDLVTSDIVPDGAENIDGAAGVLDLGKYESRTMVTDGTDWWSI